MPNNTIELVIKATDSASSQIKSIVGSIDTLKNALAGVAAAFTLDKLIDSISDAQTAQNDLNRQYAAFGAAIGVTKAQMEDFAETVSKSTTLTNESLKEAQATLLNYTSLTGKSFIEARALVVDLAAKMGVDAAQAAELLGRSLQNPISGIRLLAQVGVTLTQAQRATITSLEQTGDSAQAVNFIFASLQQRVQGAAHDLENTLGGALKNLENNFAQAFEGQDANVSGLVESIHGLSEQIQSPEFQEGIQAIVAGIVGIAKASIDAVDDIRDLSRWLDELVNGPQTERGVLEQTKASLEELIAVPNQDPAAVNGYIARLQAVQKQLDVLNKSAAAAAASMGGVNFGISGGDWGSDKAAAPKPLYDPLQHGITLGPNAQTLDFATLTGSRGQALGNQNGAFAASLVDQFQQDTENDLDKALTELNKHIEERWQLLRAGKTDVFSVLAGNDADQAAYDAQVDKAFDYIHVSAQKLKTPLDEVEKEGERVSDSLQNGFEDFFESTNHSARNFAATMINVFDQIFAKAASADIAQLLGIDKLFSKTGASTQVGGLFGAIGNLFGGGGASAAGDFSIPIAGYSAGGGNIWGPTVVGESGPELVMPGAGGASVMNARQLAFGRGGGKGGINYQGGVYNITVGQDQSAEILPIIIAQQQRDLQEFKRQLTRNGIVLR